jgi:exonuclease SbcD
MKILITADWHLGKRLHMEDFGQDMAFFLDWLLKYIEENQIDQLLVAGDIFDQNNPSNEATKQYYDFLVQLHGKGCKAIITSGNHDSPSFLETPSSLLHSLGTTVVSRFPGMEHLEKILVPVANRSGNIKAIVAAIPFLQDRFVRQVGEAEGIKEIDTKIREGMRRVFKGIGDEMKKRFPDQLHIGMAHLHAQGTKASEAEREIQIGNELGIPSDALDQFDYLGLGHIHTGQPVIQGKIHYASSPISLGFSENVYKHKIIQLEIEGNSFKQTFIPIPKFRSLYQVKGSMQEVEEKLALLKCKYDLTALVDLSIDEPIFDPKLMPRIETLKNEMAERNLKIVTQRVVFRDKSSSRKLGTLAHEKVKDLQPTAVFEKIIEGREESEEKTALKDLFNTILADATQQQP